MPNNRINYRLNSIGYAERSNPTAEILYRDLLVDVMLKKLRENGKLR